MNEECESMDHRSIEEIVDPMEVEETGVRLIIIVAGNLMQLLIKLEKVN